MFVSSVVQQPAAQVEADLILSQRNTAYGASGAVAASLMAFAAFLYPRKRNRPSLSRKLAPRSEPGSKILTKESQSSGLASDSEAKISSSAAGLLGGKIESTTNMVTSSEASTKTTTAGTTSSFQLAIPGFKKLMASEFTVDSERRVGGSSVYEGILSSELENKLGFKTVAVKLFKSKWEWRDEVCRGLTNQSQATFPRPASSLRLLC